MRFSIAEARQNLPALVRKAEAGTALELTRRGRPVAMLIGHSQFKRLNSGRKSFGAAFDDFASKWDLSALALDPEELFGDARDESPGRDIDL